MTTFFAADLKWESWIAAVLGAVIASGLVWVYATLSEYHPKQSLCQINESVFGKAAGKIISCLYIFYFIVIAVFNTDNVGSFFSDYTMFETPKAVFFIMIIAVCAYAARTGIENIMHMGSVLLVFAASALFISILLLSNRIDAQNFLPVFSQDLAGYIHASHTAAVMPFGEVIVFMMFADLTGGSIKRGYLLGLLFGALYIIILILRDISVLGVTMSVISVPDYEALRLIDIGSVFTRIELLLSLTKLTMTFMKISVIYCAAVKGLAEIAGTKDIRSQVLSLGVIIVCFAVLGFESGFQELDYGKNYHAFFAAPFTVLLPLLTLAVSAVRRRKKV